MDPLNCRLTDNLTATTMPSLPWNRSAGRWPSHTCRSQLVATPLPATSAAPPALGRRRSSRSTGAWSPSFAPAHGRPTSPAASYTGCWTPWAACTALCCSRPCRWPARPGSDRRMCHPTTYNLHRYSGGFRGGGGGAPLPQWHLSNRLFPYKTCVIHYVYLR